jgi:hypothetical protein
MAIVYHPNVSCMSSSWVSMQLEMRRAALYCHRHNQKGSICRMAAPRCPEIAARTRDAQSVPATHMRVDRRKRKLNGKGLAPSSQQYS